MMSYMLCPCCSRAGYLARYRKDQGRMSPGSEMAVAVSSSSNGGPLSQAETPRVPLSVRSEGGSRLESGVTQVHAAAVNGDKQTLARLLAMAVASEELDVGDQFGRSPLMYCVLADRPDCAEILMKAGAQVNLKDKGGRTALHWAAHKGNLRLMKLLLTRGADCREKDNEGQTALHLCTRHKLPKVMALLLRQLTPGEIDDQDKNKRTALHWAASHGNLEHVKMLIKQNSNIGIPDTEGKTPLHWAASSQDREALSCVKLVLETTPSVINWQDYEGRTALHLAVADGNESVVNVLTSVKNVNVSALDNMFRTPLHWAAVLGHSKIVSILLDSGADSSSSDANGATALHYAAQNNYSETVSVFLLRHLTDEPDLEGRTAFMWAAGTGADDVIRASLSAGVDIQQEDKTGGTALHAAALSGHSSTVKLLLDSGARLEVTDQAKHTPLFRACEMGHMDVVQTLIDYGARVDGLDQDGRSPLHWAALGGHAYICQMLIKYGDGPNVRDHSARAPLHCAAYGGFVNCMSALMEHGAEPNAQDREGMTCLHWACSKGHLDAVKLLIEYNAFPNHMEFTEDRYTPLDYALMGEHHEVAQYMIEQGALSITGIQDIAAQKIQCAFRGYRVRKAFIERKKLLMKHEKLKKEAARKRAAEEGKKAVDDKKGSQSGSPCGTTIQSKELPDSNQDQHNQQQQGMLHSNQQAESAVSLDDIGAGNNLNSQARSLLKDEEVLKIREQDVDHERNQYKQVPRHQQPSEEDAEDQDQQQQREADEHTEMLKRSRLKMRKSEERRRKLLTEEGNIEHISDQLQQHKPQEVPVTGPQGMLHQQHHQSQEQQELPQSQHKQKQVHSSKLPEQNHSYREKEQQQQHQQKHEEAAEETCQSKKHRSRSRRKRRSRSQDSNGRIDPHQEKSKTKATEHGSEHSENLNSPSRTEHGPLEAAEVKEPYRLRRTSHRDHAEMDKSHSPILPPSPRKEPPTSSQSPRKEDSIKREDTHFPALVCESFTTETVQPTTVPDTPTLPSPLPRRDESKSPSLSPFPSSHHDSYDPQYHSHSLNKNGHRSRRQSRHRRSRYEVQLETESVQGERTKLEADQTTPSDSPKQREDRDKQRHHSKRHKDEAKTELENGGASHRKPTDIEKTSKCDIDEVPKDKNAIFNQNESDSLGKEHQDKRQSKPGKVSKENFEQAPEGHQHGTAHCPDLQYQKKGQDVQQQALQLKNLKLQQQQKEEIRQAEIRKHELSKRYQGERMHSSHHERQRQTTLSPVPSSSDSTPSCRQHVTTSHIKTTSKTYLSSR
ncbi:hypothetical protein RRG08_018466 [Elysia crispata]|nr:hypothetical protein RRG08_018466 [Elysia crispata]